ncbi:MAG: GH32 C-terminal domain-containing protein [Acidimicrobiia bacterium]|nr:GH32 C-terminal domain-containing protein [Acidimicrobiia bacterium]
MSPPGMFVADSFEQEYRAPLMNTSGPVDVRAVVDSTSLEVFADDGVTVLSTTWFWDGIPPLRVGPTGDPGTPVEARVEVHSL